MPLKRYSFRCPFCGSEETKWEWWLKLLLIFTDHYYYDCPICHHRSSWLYIFHLRHESTDPKEKNFNKLPLFDERL